MFCKYHQWKISRAFDDRTALSPRQWKHIQQCSDCRHFYLICKELPRVLSPEGKTESTDMTVVLRERFAGTKSSYNIRVAAVAASITLILGLWAGMHIQSSVTPVATPTVAVKQPGELQTERIPEEIVAEKTTLRNMIRHPKGLGHKGLRFVLSRLPKRKHEDGSM